MPRDWSSDVCSSDLVNNIELTLNEGSIAGLIQAKNDILPDYRKSLETYTETLANEINNIHREGYGLDGTTGKDLFSSTNSSSIERSEEHTSELQSRGHLVCRLLLEKKKRQTAA